MIWVLRRCVIAPAVVALAGLIPLLIFWVEHKVNLKVRAENPELVAPSAV